METVGCILTVWKRPRNLPTQLAALQAQTVQPVEFTIWQNGAEGVPTVGHDLTNVRHIRTNQNTGVWPRFLAGLEMKSKFICVFDDDTIPGRRWLENCLTTMRKQAGLLGTVGVVFPTGKRRPWHRIGWPKPCDKILEADIVGHSWFFQRDWLRYHAREPRRGYSTCGEDYHFSFVLQKHLKLGTYVPPHPPNNRELWGSLKGMELGNDSVALARNEKESQKKIKTHAAYLSVGWKPMALRKRT